MLSDKSVNWKDHMRTIQNEKAKIIGLLVRARNPLNQTCLKRIYFSYIPYMYPDTCIYVYISTYIMHYIVIFFFVSYNIFYTYFFDQFFLFIVFVLLLLR